MGKLLFQGLVIFGLITGSKLFIVQQLETIEADSKSLQLDRVLTVSESYHVKSYINCFTVFIVLQLLLGVILLCGYALTIIVIMIWIHIFIIRWTEKQCMGSSNKENTKAYQSSGSTGGRRSKKRKQHHDSNSCQSTGAKNGTDDQEPPLKKSNKDNVGAGQLCTCIVTLPLQYPCLLSECRNIFFLVREQKPLKGY